MIGKIHKDHVRLLLFTLVSSLGVLVLAILWDLRVINLPSPLVYYVRLVSNSIYSLPAGDVKLALKFHRQEHSLSCEAAALKMVLDFHGLNISESEIISKIAVDPTPRSGDVWGNPHLGFVGNIDGKMMVDGYGVYWEPIAVATSRWKKVRIIKNGLAEDLIEHLSDGRPIIVWGYLGRGQPVNWKTPEGETVWAVNGEHTRVVYGFKGSAKNPDGFFVMDPIYGVSYWEKSKFLRNWDSFGRMGVVVYP